MSSEPETIGFVGLGSMGEPMARNVLEDGYSLRAYNRTREKTEALGEEGATVCASPEEAADGADAVITMVANSEALFDVLEGSEGVLAAVDGETTVVNTCTVSHETTSAVAERVSEAGGRFVDSPVSGTVGPANEGTLTMLAAGEHEDVARVEPVLSAMGEPVIRCGAVGQGTNAKLFVNLLLGDLMESFAEALTFGDAHNLAPETMLSVVEAGGVNAPMFGVKGEQIRSGDFEARFSVDLLSKDLSLVLDAADDADVPLAVTAATAQAASATRALGHGSEDMAAFVRHLEDVTGREIRDTN